MFHASHIGSYSQRLLFESAFIIIALQALTLTTCAQTDQQVVAVVGDKVISQKELDDSVAAQILPLEAQLYAIRRVALENLIARAVLEAEAAKRGMSVDELRKQLTAGRTEVTTSQVEQAYAENASAFAAMSPDEAKERIRLDLEAQIRIKNYLEALTKLTKTYKVEFLLREPLVVTVKIENAPARGPSGAPITIVEFADFECPFCRSSQVSLKRVLQAYKNEVRLVFMQRPLDGHPAAFPAARAAFCAGKQGSFWEYHDALFTSDDLSSEALNRFASNLKLDLTKFSDCLKGEESRLAVISELKEAQRLGINSTPTFIINGRLFRGAPSFDDFKTVIDKELAARESVAK